MRTLFLLTSAGVLLAQNAPHIRDWKPPAGESRAQAKSTCAALHSLTGYEYSVISADALPGFCRVLLQVMPEIRIEVSLPDQWNRRLYMFGNGGFAGESLEAPNRVAQRDTALKAGFAVTQTNTGHDAQREPEASFAVNPQKLLDYSFRSLHVTAVTAKRVVAAFYGMAPAKSYYNGCSTGGRQGLQFAQRYPEDFDGIVAGAPSLDSTANRARAIANAQALEKGPLAVAKLKLLAAKVYAKCDAVDGLTDGLIDDPRRCDFVPARDLPKCAGANGDDCFTASELSTLEALYGDVTAKGQRLAPGYVPGVEAIGPNGQSGWDGWILRAGGHGQSAQYALSALRWMVFPKPMPEYEFRQFDFERDTPALDKVARLMSAKDPDLSRFHARGGKLLMYFGWADPALNPRLAIEYYEAVQKKLGLKETGDFVRLFMMPGVFHCSAGVGPACFDVLEQIIPWVEEGKAPERIVAAQIDQGKTVRSRPLCAYPRVARLKAGANAAEAAGFECVLP